MASGRPVLWAARFGEFVNVTWAAGQPVQLGQATAAPVKAFTHARPNVGWATHLKGAVQVVPLQGEVRVAVCSLRLRASNVLVSTENSWALARTRMRTTFSA